MPEPFRAMHIVVAPDSFKGSLSAPDAARAIAEGWRRVHSTDRLNALPVADGGEGTIDAIISAAGGTLPHLPVSGSLPGRDRLAYFGSVGDGSTVIVELAQAAGLTLVPAAERDPKRATTYGVGTLIRAALVQPNAAHLAVALGGSATNDGGAGMLQALGVRLLDANDREIGRGGAELARLVRADFSAAERAPGFAVTLACDVDNPLLGARGASGVFGPQKGATADDVVLLDAALAHFADVLTRATGRDVRDIPGAGAAGGAAAGLLWLFPQAVLRPGIEIVLDAIRFDEVAGGADVVIVGEGRLDAQTLGGKAAAGVLRRAATVAPRARRIALVGTVEGDRAALARALGLDAIHALTDIAPSPAAAIANAAAYLSALAERAAREPAIGGGA